LIVHTRGLTAARLRYKNIETFTVPPVMPQVSALIHNIDHFGRLLHPLALVPELHELQPLQYSTALLEIPYPFLYFCQGYLPVY
ncbi:MAG: hypothetical protein QXP36_12695, partial [Conexivisphaerales archaeon]